MVAVVALGVSLYIRTHAARAHLEYLPRSFSASRVDFRTHRGASIMKRVGRRELLKTLATISGAAVVTKTARGRTLKPANAPARCSGNTLNVILHGMFAVTADDQNITLVMPKVAGHYYAAGDFGMERALRLDGAGPLSYNLSVPGWKPSAPEI